MPPLIRDHSVDGPLAIAQAIMGDLEPLEARGAGGGSVVYLGKIVLYWT